MELKAQTVFSIGGIRTKRTVRNLNESQDQGIAAINNAFYSVSRSSSQEAWQATHKVNQDGTDYIPVFVHEKTIQSNEQPAAPEAYDVVTANGEVVSEASIETRKYDVIPMVINDTTIYCDECDTLAQWIITTETETFYTCDTHLSKYDPLLSKDLLQHEAPLQQQEEMQHLQKEEDEEIPAFTLEQEVKILSGANAGQHAQIIDTMPAPLFRSFMYRVELLPTRIRWNYYEDELQPLNREATDDLPTSLLELIHYHTKQTTAIRFHVSNNTHAVRIQRGEPNTGYTLFDVRDGDFAKNGGYFIDHVQNDEDKMLKRAKTLGFDVEHGWIVVVL